MMEDKFLFMSDAQALTTAEATDSTNTLDLTEDGDARVRQAWWIVRVNTKFTSGGSATLACELQTSADDSSYAALPGMSLAATAVASLTAGAVLVKQPLPLGVKRYLKTVHTVGTADMTAGKIDSFITFEPDSY